MNARSILLEAADELEADPSLWTNMCAPVEDCKGAECTWSRFFCIAEKEQIEEALIQALGEEPTGLVRARVIWDWNDCPERKVEEVIDLYRRAADFFES